MRDQVAAGSRRLREVAVAMGAVLGFFPVVWFYMRLTAKVPVREAMLWTDGLAALAIGLSVALASVHYLSRRRYEPAPRVVRQATDFDVLDSMEDSPGGVSGLNAKLAHCVQALEAQAGIVALWDQQTATLTPIAQCGLGETGARQGERITPSRPFRERVLVRGQSLALTGRREMAWISDRPDWRAMSACLCIPLLGPRSTMGMLAVAYREGGRFSALDEDVLKSVGQQVGAAVIDGRLREHNDMAIKELALLQHIDQQLSATLDADVVCEAVVSGARRLIPTDTSFLGLFTPSGELALVYASGCHYSWSDTAGRPRICWGVEEGLAVHGPETHTVSDVDAGPPTGDPGGFIAAEGIKAWVGAPFQAACPLPAVPAPPRVGQLISVVRPAARGQWGEVKGVLYVANRRPTTFDAYQAQLLADLAARSAISIANACLFSTVERSKQEWEATVDAIEDVCLAVDPDYTVRRCNRAAAEARGLTPQQVVGKKCYRIFHNQEEPVEDCPVVKSLRTGDRAFVESFNPQTGRMYHKWAYPLFDDRAHVWTVVEYSRDVTAFKQAQARLLQEEKFSALRQTLSGAAHELNNPLAVIMGYAQLLQDTHDPQEIRQGLDSIHRQAQRAREVVGNLLTFAPVQPREGQEQAVALPRVDVNELLEHVLTLRAYTLCQKGVEVTTELASDLPRISADSSRLQQAFLNIVASAEQALERVDEPRRLIVDSRPREEGGVLISIMDNGPAIPPSAFSALFIPFLTAEETGEEDTRLGLSTSYRIVRDLGGHLWAQNNPGGGATFFVALPLPSSNAEENPVIAPGRGIDNQGSPSLKIARPRILLIDDESAIVALLQRTLTPLGYEVDGLMDGNAALSLLEERIYDLVILDVRLPGPDGRQIYALINERWPTLRQRVIFSTGDTASVDTRRFLEERGVPYLIKPFDLEQVQSVVEDRIGKLGRNQ
jgi:signal transduction histidine kinase/CheY-like chemotaxis protein/GAF domain-containing protein